MSHNSFKIKGATSVLLIMEENYTVIISTQIRQSTQHHSLLQEVKSTTKDC